MRVVILPNEQEVSFFAADSIANVIKQNPSAVLGLATGGSPLLTYEILIDKYRQGRLSFKNTCVFNLDEYIGLPPTHSQSYRFFMNKYLFEHIDIDIQNTYIPECASNKYEQCCQNYEASIAEHGGIDIQLLGLGDNGHIGFNEPTSSLSSKTRIKTLTEKTIENNSRFFSSSEFQPSLAITMGIGTILESKSILLIATGKKKKKAVVDMIEGPLSAMCPASSLQLHDNAVIVLDEVAASGLELCEYYLYTEQVRNAVK